MADDDESTGPSSSKKSTGTKRATGAKKATGTKKSTGARKSAGATEQGDRRRAPRAEQRTPAKATEVAARAGRELLELTGREVEGVVGLRRGESGWVVEVEVVEVRRIPDTTDVLGLYEVETDAQGALQAYRRERRYLRGSDGGDHP